MEMSDDGNMLAVAYLYTEGAAMKSKVIYYNFGETGQERTDNIVLSEEDDGTVMADIYFMGDDRSVVVGDNRFVIYRGREIPEKEKEIELETDMDESAMVEADESLLELVWNNLLSNAVKFTPPGGTIAVKQSTQEGLVTVSVSDTGCGMDAESMKHIFDKFYQGDTSHSGEGNGLGLALVKRVLELLDGEIRVESEPGKGSTFLVTLPAASAAGRTMETGESDRKGA